MRHGQFSLEVIVHGRPIREYNHHGQVFVEGRRGLEFDLRVYNHTPRRVAAVISVDGLSVIDGQAAREDGSGYIVSPHDKVDVPGWRLNNQNAARFVFSSLPDSYAAQMGQPTNVGVVGVTFWNEKEYRLDQPPRRSMGRPKGLSLGDFGPTRSAGVGTGFGREIEHQVSSVHFKREHSFVAQLVLRYDDAEGLRKLGITVVSSHDYPDHVIEANPFPASGSGCQPPSGWRG